MHEKILVATDGSEPGCRAVQVAGDLAKVHDAELVLLHVVDPDDEMPDWVRYADAHALGFVGPTGGIAVPPGQQGGRDIMVEEVRRSQERAREVAEGLLEESRRIATGRGARRIKTRLEEGAPADNILKAAEREHADLIVMGSRGFGNLKGLFAGSVSREVASKAECSCIAVT